MDVPGHSRVGWAALNSVPVNEKICTKETRRTAQETWWFVTLPENNRQTNKHSLGPEGYKIPTDPTSALQQRVPVSAN